MPVPPKITYKYPREVYFIISFAILYSRAVTTAFFALLLSNICERYFALLQSRVFTLFLSTQEKSHINASWRAEVENIICQENERSYGCKNCTQKNKYTSTYVCELQILVKLIIFFH